jgi:two-component system response regulator MtrA
MRCVRILVDVASERLCEEILELLARAGHTVERGRGRPFDVALVGSAEAAHKLRREHPTDAIIVVTKIGDVPARIAALEAGADDAFDASFPPSQMMARVGAAGRRAAMIPKEPERLLVDGCTIDLSAASATRDGHAVELTKLEVELVRWLARKAGQVVDRRELLQHVWKVSPASATRAVDVAIAGLRSKIEKDPSDPAIIVSVRGAGYLLTLR